MKALPLVAVFAVVCWLSCPSDLVAKGAGGGHGSGGHASGGHASSGRSSGGHTDGSHGSTTSHGTAAPRSSTGSTHGTGRVGGPSAGTAVPRPPSGAVFVSGSPNYLPSRIIWPPYSTVLGLSAFGLASNPFWSMYGTRYGLGSYAYDYGSLWPYSEYGSTFPFDDFDDAGSLRLQVTPKDAQVYVDGYYAGLVDDFDGHFQHLDLSPQPHHVEIRAPGYQPLAFDVTIHAHHKTNYRGTLLPSTP